MNESSFGKFQDQIHLILDTRFKRTRYPTTLFTIIIIYIINTSNV